MNRKIVITACAFGCIAVLTGAFGAHGLKSVLNATELDQWKTAVSYQFYHTFALLFIAVTNFKSKLINAAYLCFTLGIILFSGSIYLLATRSVTNFYWSFLGPLTPIGGFFFIVGWLNLLIAAAKNK